MAKKKKNSNYITEKTIAKKQLAAKQKRNAKIKKYALISIISVLIAACVIVGLVLIASGINKYWDKRYYEEYQVYHLRYRKCVPFRVDTPHSISCPNIC